MVIDGSALSEFFLFAKGKKKKLYNAGDNLTPFSPPKKHNFSSSLLTLLLSLFIKSVLN